MIRLRSIAWSFVLLGFYGIFINRAHAIGWDSNDFLVGGGPDITDRIAVYDFDFTFKGYLDTNIPTVQGMDFNAAGQLVAVAPGPRIVRVYDSSGAIVGGFSRGDDAMRASSDLRVAPDGTYIIGQTNQFGAEGARRFSTDGQLIQQYGKGSIQSVAIVPGNRVWIGGPGVTDSRIAVYDIDSGIQVGSVSLPGQVGRNSMSYSSVTNTVLVIDTQTEAILEADLAGNLLRRFEAPFNLDLKRSTRGPDGEVFATDGFQRVLHWKADGTFVGSFSTSAALGYPNAIVWTGNIPEPGANVFLVGALCVLAQRAGRRRVQTQLQGRSSSCHQHAFRTTKASDPRTHSANWNRLRAEFC